MFNQDSVKRLDAKSPLHAIQVELQHGYALSPVEAQVLAQRLQQLVDEQTGYSRGLGQITYQAIDVNEPAGKPLEACRKVAVHLTLFDQQDVEILASQGTAGLRRIRVHRLVHEALMQGGALSQEDLSCLMGTSLRSIKRIFAHYRQVGAPLPSRGELQDIGRGVSHKVPVIRRYIQGLGFTEISRSLGNHGIESMGRYLRHFALVMILDDRGLSPEQMQSVIGISCNLIAQYRQLYAELNQPEYQLTLTRLKRLVLPAGRSQETTSDAAAPVDQEKRGLS
jgi:hypothetical protein